MGRGFKRGVPGLLAPLLLAAVLVVIGGPYLRILALEFRALAGSLRNVSELAGESSIEHDVCVAYDPDQPPRLTNGLHFAYETCGGEIKYETPIVRDEWTERGVLALRLGSLPLLALCLIAWALRRRARVLPGTWTLDRSSWRTKAWLAGLVYLPFVAFAIPLALGLSVWVVVEEYPWIEWFDLRVQLVEQVLSLAGPIFAGGTLLAGGLLLHDALRSRSRAPGVRGGWRSRVLWAAIVVVASLAVLPGVLIAGLHAARLAPVLGTERRFERACSGCHDATVPLAYVRTPDEWRESLELVHPQGSADDARMREEVLEFLGAMRSFPAAWIFRTRCLQCHGHWPPDWEGRPPADWKGVVDRVGRYSPFYFNSSARAQVVRHLVATWPGEGRPLSGYPASAVLDTVRACTNCHFFSRGAEAYRDVSAADALDLIRRMNERLVAPLDEERVRVAAGIWRALVRDPAELARRIPHDRAIMSPGREW